MISLCLVTTLYSLGVIELLKKMVSVVPSMPIGGSNTENHHVPAID